LQKVIDRFLLESQEYYLSQWLAYLDEIKLEEFEDYSKAVTVSTIHKSKGMEFEKVILLIDQTPKTDEDRRLYYVGMTRAKKELTIIRHDNSRLDRQGFVEYYFDDTNYMYNEKVVTLIMSLRDINLGFKGNYNDNLTELLAGDSVCIEMRGKSKTLSIVHNNRVIGFLSGEFHNKIEKYLNKNYIIDSAIIDFVVHWYNKNSREYIKHPLCKIVLRNRTTNI